MTEWDGRGQDRWPGAFIAVAKFLGIGAIVAGGLTLVLWLILAVLLIGPLLFWVGWNELGLGPSMGLPELGFWAIVGATLFLCLGWFGKVVVTGVVFVLEPDWLAGTAQVSWPEPTLRNFVAVALLAMLAVRPHAQHHRSSRRVKPAAAAREHVTV